MRRGASAPIHELPFLLALGRHDHGVASLALRGDRAERSVASRGSALILVQHARQFGGAVESMGY